MEESNNRQTVNYGLIKAIFVGVNPPLNTKIIWYDDRPNEKIHKYYDVITEQWLPFGGGGTVVNGANAYIGYATGCNGEDFSLVKTDEHTHWAIRVTPTPIDMNDLDSDFFQGRWTEYCMDVVNRAGDYTYVRYSDDVEGANFSDKPTYETPCEECDYINGFEVTDSSSSFDPESIRIEPQNDGIRVIFNNAFTGNNSDNSDFIEFDIKRDNIPLFNETEQFFEITQEQPFTVPFATLEIIADNDNEQNRYLYRTDPNNQETFLRVVNDSNIKIKIFFDEGIGSFGNISGEIFMKIANSECENFDPNEICTKCRKYMAIITSPTPIADEEVTPDKFDGFWIPIGGGCGCSDGDTNSSGEAGVSQSQLDNLSNRQTQDRNEMQAQIEANRTDIENDRADYIQRTEKNSEDIANNLNDTDNAIRELDDSQTQMRTDLAKQISDFNELRDQFNSDGIMALIGDALDALLLSLRENILNPRFDGIENINTGQTEAIDLLQNIKDDHEQRISDLENINPTM